MNVKARIDELRVLLEKYNYEYYVLANTTLTDQEYDRYMQELMRLEEQYPELVREDSPTKRVSGQAIDEFKKVTHEIPMLSIGNVFNESEIINFDNRIKKEVPNPKYM